MVKMKTFALKLSSPKDTTGINFYHKIVLNEISILASYLRIVLYFYHTLSLQDVNPIANFDIIIFKSFRSDLPTMHRPKPKQYITP